MGVRAWGLHTSEGDYDRSLKGTKMIPETTFICSKKMFLEQTSFVEGLVDIYLYYYYYFLY